jgi:hypothetical protein
MSKRSSKKLRVESSGIAWWEEQEGGDRRARIIMSLQRNTLVEDVVKGIADAASDPQQATAGDSEPLEPVAKKQRTRADRARKASAKGGFSVKVKK